MATSTLPRTSTGPKKVKFFNKQLEKNLFFCFFSQICIIPAHEISTNQIFAVLYGTCCLMPEKKKSLKLKNTQSFPILVPGAHLGIPAKEG